MCPSVVMPWAPFEFWSAPISLSSSNSRFLGRILEPGFHHFRRARAREVLSLFLLLSFLAPYGAGPLLPLLLAEPVCKMECCRKSKMCGRKEVRDHRGQMEWFRTSACCKSCNEVPSLPRAKCVDLPCGSIKSALFCSEVSLAFCELVLKFVPATATVLFQRPPPPL